MPPAECATRLRRCPVSDDLISRPRSTLGANVVWPGGPLFESKSTTADRNARRSMCLGTSRSALRFIRNRRRPNSPHSNLPHSFELGPFERHQCRSERLPAIAWPRQRTRSFGVCSVPSVGKSALSELHRLGRGYTQQVSGNYCETSGGAKGDSALVGRHSKSSQWSNHSQPPQSSLAGVATGRLPCSSGAEIRLGPFASSWR